MLEARALFDFANEYIKTGIFDTKKYMEILLARIKKDPKMLQNEYPDIFVDRVMPLLNLKDPHCEEFLIYCYKQKLDPSLLFAKYDMAYVLEIFNDSKSQNKFSEQNATNDPWKFVELLHNDLKGTVPFNVREQIFQSFEDNKYTMFKVSLSEKEAIKYLKFYIDILKILFDSYHMGGINAREEKRIEEISEFFNYFYDKINDKDYFIGVMIKNFGRVSVSDIFGVDWLLKKDRLKEIYRLVGRYNPDKLKLISENPTDKRHGMFFITMSPTILKSANEINKFYEDVQKYGKGNKNAQRVISELEDIIKTHIIWFPNYELAFTDDSQESMLIKKFSKALEIKKGDTDSKKSSEISSTDPIKEFETAFGDSSSFPEYWSTHKKNFEQIPDIQFASRLMSLIMNDHSVTGQFHGSEIHRMLQVILYYIKVGKKHMSKQLQSLNDLVEKCNLDYILTLIDMYCFFSRKYRKYGNRLSGRVFEYITLLYYFSKIQNKIINVVNLRTMVTGISLFGEATEELVKSRGMAENGLVPPVYEFSEFFYLSAEDKGLHDLFTAIIGW